MDLLTCAPDWGAAWKTVAGKTLLGKQKRPIVSSLPGLPGSTALTIERNQQVVKNKSVVKKTAVTMGPTTTSLWNAAFLRFETRSRLEKPIIKPFLDSLMSSYRFSPLQLLASTQNKASFNKT
jgi:hypothetical protein